MDFSFESAARGASQRAASSCCSETESSVKGGFRTGVAASPRDLAPIHRRTVAACFHIAGKSRLLRGHGHYETDPDLGKVLRIEVEEPAGTIELVLVESQWTGSVESGDALGCDYLVHL